MQIPVLLPNIFNHPFTYEFDKKLSPGTYVKVPFGKKDLTGVVWNLFEKKIQKKFKLKKIKSIIQINPLKIETINFLNWFSNYNLVPIGMCLKLHLLGGDAITKFDDKEYLIFNNKKTRQNFKLSEDQNKVFREMLKKNGEFRVHLLQGTTGSGKTIVYFKQIEEILKKGYQAIILLPEIGLTSEFEKKFEEFFGFKAAIWHSGVTPKRKKIIWSGVASGLIKVVIGARSSLFLPFKKIGLIVIDEEHDQSFKQDEGVIYNARDMAIARANFENIPINLVTAVPSLETYANVKKNKYSISRLIKRYKDANLPSFEIIDLNNSRLNKQSWIATETLKKVKDHLKKNDQVLFFMNRRGFAPYALCKNCAKVYSCPNCSINLVYHKGKNILLCHYCGFKSKLNRNCSKGNTCDFVFSGPGVERIAEEVKILFPDKKISIFSSDTMNKKSSKDQLESIVNGEVDILIGTQLISKGFHFPNLNCIIVVDIDLSSSGHDLRGTEKNLQLYHQLSGRAGRSGKPATVYFQTYNTDLNSIKNLTNSDPDIFLGKELELRKKNNLPPFQRFISLIITGSDEKKAELESIKFKEFIEKQIKDKILGPVNAPIFRIKRKYRLRLLVRGRKSLNLQSSLSKIISKYKFPHGIKLTVDVDPINFN